MKDRQTQLAERVARQTKIDTHYVDPIWTPNVNVPQLELLIACPLPQNPVVLLPEMRFKSLLKLIVECLPPVGKLMIVDSVNTRFEAIRNLCPGMPHSLYFSAQNLGALNYSEGIFSALLTQLSLPTLAQARRILPEYARVLRVGGRIVAAIPLWGSFPAFFDLLQECLLKLSPAEADLSEIKEAMSLEFNQHLCEQFRLKPDANDIETFELVFDNVEQLLFSTLVESNFLSYCLAMQLERTDPKQLLMLLVRAFHHYFQNETLRVPFKIAIFGATKQDKM